MHPRLAAKENVMEPRTKKRSAKRKRQEAVLVRLSQDEAAILREIASREGRARPDVLRRLLAAVDTRPSASPNKGSRMRLSQMLLEEGDRAAVAGLTAAIGMCNGALIQAAKTIRVSGLSPMLHTEIEAALAEGRRVYAVGHGILTKGRGEAIE